MIEELKIDFNDVGGADGRSLEAVLPAGLTVEPGDGLSLVDAEGNRCWAQVVATKGRLAVLRLDLDTWLEHTPRVAIPNAYGGVATAFVVGHKTKIVGVNFKSDDFTQVLSTDDPLTTIK